MSRNNYSNTLQNGFNFSKQQKTAVLSTAEFSLIFCNKLSGICFHIIGNKPREFLFQFIQDIKTLKERNQHVILSIGGAEGTIYITSQAAADNFANSLIKVIEQFGFEGVDIDLEGGAVAGTEYIAGALRKVHNHFGDEFIITMAPETYYKQSPTSNYFKLALDIKDILTVVNMQYYNSGSMVGYGGGVYSCGSVDFLTSLATLLIENG